MPARNRRSLLALSTLLAVLLVSCGTENESDTESGVESSAQPSAPLSAPLSAPSGESPGRGPVANRPPDGGRPGGNPPGVRHDLPRVDNDLTDQDDWDRARRNACREARQNDNCLRAVYQVRRQDPSGRLSAIPNPGPGYADGEDPEFESCTVRQISPPTGDDRQVPAGSTITISIICIPRERKTTPSSSSSAEESNTNETGN